MQTNHDDHKPFEPHAYADHQRYDPHTHLAVTDSSNPQDLGNDYIAGDQRPIERREGTLEPVHHHVPLIGAAAVPSHERLHHIAVRHDQTGCEHDLRHVPDVTHRDVVLQPVVPSQRYRKRQHHRKTRV